MNAPVPQGHGAELYIYYRIRREDAQAAAADFAQAAADAPVRLLERSDDGGDLLTWMEIYPSAQAADGDLRQRIAQRMQPWLQGPRHEERFVALAIRTSQG